MTGIEIRPYRAGDRDQLIDLFRGSVRRVAGRDYCRVQVLARAPDEIDAQSFGRRRSDKPTFVATIAGVAVGFIDLEPDGHIDMLFVHADHQARGIGGALLAHVEALARRQRMNRLHTESSITARPVFERHGFRIIARQSVALLGQRLTNYRMEKLLA